MILSNKELLITVVKSCLTTGPKPQEQTGKKLKNRKKKQKKIEKKVLMQITNSITVNNEVATARNASEDEFEEELRKFQARLEN